MQDAFIKADQHFSELVAQITDEQWEQTVPATPDWTVKKLVNHVTENNGAVCKTFGGSDELNADPSSDPAGAWRESADNAETFARAVSDLDQVVHGLMGDIPAGSFLNMMLADRVLHGHDLAEAIAVDTAIDPELVRLAYEFIKPNAAKLQESGMFGPAVDVADGASQQDKLLALTGRKP